MHNGVAHPRLRLDSTKTLITDHLIRIHISKDSIPRPGAGSSDKLIHKSGFSQLAILESGTHLPRKMAASIPKKQKRRRLSKSSKPENIVREQENIDPRSKEQPSTPYSKVPISQKTISPPSKVLHIDGCSIPRTDSSLYFITFTGCKHHGFHMLSKNPIQDTFASSLKFFSPTSATPVEVTQMYTFDKPCLECNPKASIPLENPRNSILAFSGKPLENSEEPFLASLEKSEKWVVSWPMVAPTVPDAIRRFGKFDFEDDQDQAQGEHERTMDGSDRANSLRSYKMTELIPLYVEDLRTPADHVDTPVEHSATPAEDLGVRAKGCGTRAKDLCTRPTDLGTPAKKTKARRRWRKVRIVSRL